MVALQRNLSKFGIREVARGSQRGCQEILGRSCHHHVVISSDDSISGKKGTGSGKSSKADSGNQISHLCLTPNARLGRVDQVREPRQVRLPGLIRGSDKKNNTKRAAKSNGPIDTEQVNSEGTRKKIRLGLARVWRCQVWERWQARTANYVLFSKVGAAAFISVKENEVVRSTSYQIAGRNSEYFTENPVSEQEEKEKWKDQYLFGF
ncbi:hypothetical protein ACFX12_028550 [Malus domestica]